MPDMLRDGLAWLDEQRSAHLSQTVTYQRGSASVSVLATLGRSEFEVDDPSTGARVSVEVRDYLITAADLVLDGAVVLPQIGDRIVEAEVGEQVFTVEVLAPGPAIPHYRFSDSYRTTLRVHTKHIATDPGA